MKTNNIPLISKTLDEMFPDAHCELDHRNSFELLIAVVLSAQTTDQRVNTVTPVLFEKYPDAFLLSKANQTDVEEIIKPIGLYRNKAKNIISLATKLIEDFPQNKEQFTYFINNCKNYCNIHQ